MYDIYTKGSHVVNNQEYKVPTKRSLTISVLSAIYYVLICYMTPHLQATHLVVLMQSSCVFSGVLFCCLHLADWTWYRVCQFALGCTSLILMVYVLLFLFMCRVSLFINKSQCCPTIIISTILFIIAVILNAYSTALTTQTLLKYVCYTILVKMMRCIYMQPSPQNAFEFHVYRYESYFSVLLVYLLYAFRNPPKVNFVDFIEFLSALVKGVKMTFVRSHVCDELQFSLSLFLNAYSKFFQDKG